MKALEAHVWTVRVLSLTLGLALVGCATGGDGNDDNTAGSASQASVQEAVTVTVPSGTVLAVEFVDSVSSETSVAGDRFTARVVDTIIIDGQPAINAGDQVVGSVVEAVPSKKIGGKASLHLEFQALLPSSGPEVPLSAAFVQEGKKQAGKDAATIGGATAGGAILGRIIGHQSDEDADGTAIGAVVGAAVGTAIAATNEGDPVTVPSGTVVEIRLDAPLEVTVS